MERYACLMVLALLFSMNAFSDIMNLNEFMPARLEDATTVDEKIYDLQIASQIEDNELNLRSNFRYGATRRLQFEAVLNELSGGPEKGSGEPQFGGQYLLNKSDNYLPEIGLSPMIVLPTGKINEGVDTHLRMNMTTTVVGSSNTPTTQIHFNIDWAHNAKNQNSERPNSFLYIMGLSHKYCDSGALIVDLFREEETEENEAMNMFELGTQFDLGKNYLVGLGGGLGFGEQSPPWHGILSFEKQI
jgi:hypothetical protein